MTTFEEILPALRSLLLQEQGVIQSFLPVLVNRDLNGRIRIFIDAVHEPVDEGAGNYELQSLIEKVSAALDLHVGKVDQILGHKENLSDFIQTSPTFPFTDQEGRVLPGVYLADRLAQEATWETISDRDDASRVPRVVFYSISAGA